MTQQFPPDSQPQRILVVDDNADAASTLSDLLDMLGYQARTAGDARAALALVDSFAPQLALMDIGLPGTDGYQLAGMCRKLPQGGAIKLVALTGYGRDTAREQATGAGFDAHLVKPVTVDTLLETIQKLLGAR